MFDVTHDSFVTKIVRKRVRPDAQQSDESIERRRLLGRQLQQLRSVQFRFLRLRVVRGWLVRGRRRRCRRR